jgi:phosphomevalonate kinase
VSRYYVPGNILLTGEYAVTESEGLGIALAIGKYVEMTIHPGTTFRVVGLFGGSERIEISENSIPGEGFLLQIIEFICGKLGITPGDLAGTIEIDSRAFYDLQGKKLGYGSSAAVTIALCTGIAILSGLTAHDADNVISGAAVEAHRFAQNGRGSGYDILASIHGGIGLVIGGSSPRWEPITLTWLESIGLINLEHPVTTTGALSQYEAWKNHNPLEYIQFLCRSNHLVKLIANSRSFDDARTHLETYRDFGVLLGEAIGADADVPKSLRKAFTDDVFYKAVGAGNELVGFIAQDFSRVSIADRDGLTARGATRPSGVRIERLDRRGAEWR